MNRDLFADIPITVVEFGLTWLCQSAALLALGLVAGRVLRGRGPAVQSAVYRTTLAAVLICPVASTVLGAAGVESLRLRPPVAALVAAPTPEPVVPPSPIPEPAGGELAKHRFAAVEPSLDAALPVPPAEPPAPALVAVGPSPPPAPAAIPTPASPSPWVGIAVAAGLLGWLLGAAVIGLRMVVAGWRMGRLRAAAIGAEPEAEALCRDLAARMRLASPRVLRSPFLASPCIDGLRRPAILLPEDDADADLRATFIHELAHLARHDGLWNLLRRVASALLWFQPLLWALSRRIEVTAEEVCDDHVVQFGADRASYAGLLLELAGRSLPPLSPTGVGMVSLRSLLARRVVRILDPSRALSTRAGTRAVLMTLSAGLAGTLLVGLLAVGGREPKARAAEPAQPEALAATETVTGQVVDAAGRPATGATVLTIASRGLPDEPGLSRYLHQSRQVARTVTDANGRFRITQPKAAVGADGQPTEGMSTYVEQPGYGVMPYFDGKVLPLVPDDAPVLGRLVDLEGKPVAGVSVRPTKLFMPWPAEQDLADSPSGWFDIGKSLGYGNEYLDTLPSLTTDADGRFRLDGIGRRRMVELEITRPDLAVKRVLVQTRAIDRVAEPPPSPTTRHGLDEPGQHGANCTITVEPTRVVTGVVRDIVTNRPIAGAIVTATRLDDSNSLLHGDIMARTDGEGRYRLVGLPKCPSPAVAVYPPLDQPYFVTENLKVPVGPGYEPVAFDIALRRAQWITGRVSSIRDNQPVQATIDYYPLIANDRARDYPNFDPDIVHSVPYSRRYQTDAAGRFRIPGLAGQGVVTARTTGGGYRAGFGSETVAGKYNDSQLPTYNQIDIRNFQAIRPVTAPETGEPVTADLPLDPGGSVTLRIVDEAGAPVLGADTSGLFPQGSNGTHLLDDRSTATVAGLEPGTPRTVLVTHKARRIGAVVELPATGPIAGQEQTVVLRPLATVTGRLVGTRVTDKMQVDIELKQAGVITHPDAMRYLDNVGEVVADAAGTFRFDGLAAGGTYHLDVRDRSAPPDAVGRMAENFRPFPLADKLMAQPGQMIDLGTFDVGTGQRVEGPPATPRTTTIAGQVVGPDGRPVPNAVVVGFATHGQSVGEAVIRPRIEAREIARSVADAEGRYTIVQPILDPGPAGGSDWKTNTYAQAPGFGISPLVDGKFWPLVPDNLPVTGRLVNPEGQPVAGASVRVLRIVAPVPGQPDPPTGWFDLVRGRRPARAIGLGTDGASLFPLAKVDAAGQFRIDGVGRGRLVELEITGPTVATKRISVVTRLGERAMPPPDAPARSSPLDEPGQFGAHFSVVVEPTRVIEGTVRDLTTHEAIGGAVVSVTQLDKGQFLVDGEITAQADAQGHYRLVGLPKSKAPTLSVYPPVDRPYFIDQRLAVPDSPGYDPIPFDIALKPGIWVTGRVSNVKTGEPVAAAVDYFPFLDNPVAQGYPNFRPQTMLSTALKTRSRTDAAGNFRVVALPGRGVVTARTDSGAFRVGIGAEAIPPDATRGQPTPGQLPTYDRIFTDRYQAIREVDIPAGAATFSRDLPVDPGGSVLVHLVDEAGQPVPNVGIPAG